jgi:hypothetical protein
MGWWAKESPDIRLKIYVCVVVDRRVGDGHHVLLIICDWNEDRMSKGVSGPGFTCSRATHRCGINLHFSLFQHHGWRMRNTGHHCRMCIDLLGRIKVWDGGECVLARRCFSLSLGGHREFIMYRGVVLVTASDTVRRH